MINILVIGYIIYWDFNTKEFYLGNFNFTHILCQCDKVNGY